MEEPHQARYFLDMLEQLGLHENLMFASDYPHWDWDSPEGAFPVKLSDELREGIYYQNARRLYRLPALARTA
jgi:predicted TIM-barrel fold metal-dependent hydrolase